MSFAPRYASQKSAQNEFVGALARIAVVFAVAVVVTLIARLTMGPPLF